MSVMKESVAGAARSLWMERMGASDYLQENLMRSFGQSIVYSEAMTKLGDRFAGVTPAGFAVLIQKRWRVAEAAQYLFMTYGTDSGWLVGSRAGQIIDVFEKVGLSMPRDSSVADAAQWLHMNRLHCKPGYLCSLDSESIIRVFKIASSWARHEDKKYSLSDLRRAYDMGFGNSGEGWNQEIHPDYLDKENYQAERHEALREFN